MGAKGEDGIGRWYMEGVVNEYVVEYIDGTNEVYEV